MVLSGYEGYTKGKRRDADLAIREEIQRCGTRARNHLLNVHDSGFREKKLDVSKAAKACCNTIDMLIEDIDKSDDDHRQRWALLLFYQASLAGGIEVEDPGEFVKIVNQLLKK